MADSVDLLAAWAALSVPDDQAWAVARPGPPLDAVTARLSSVPQPFLDPRVSIAALGGDVVGAPDTALAPFADDARVRRAAAIGLWLVASESVVEPLAPPLTTGVPAQGVRALALRLAAVSDPTSWLWDGERREEAARTFLVWSGFVPAGEDAATARALWQAHDSLARDALLAEAFADERHHADIARRLAEARAREAAARYSPE